MSTNNIGFYEDLTKIIFELSSNTHLISSAALGLILGLLAYEVDTLLCLVFPRDFSTQLWPLLHIKMCFFIIFIFCYVVTK